MFKSFNTLISSLVGMAKTIIFAAVKRRSLHIGLLLVTCWLLLSVGAWVIGKSVFYHTHLLDDGRMVQHSHPYNKSSDSTPFKQHHHTDAQLAAITQLNIVFYSEVPDVAFVAESQTVFYFPEIFHTKILQRSCHGDRAPPALISS